VNRLTHALFGVEHPNAIFSVLPGFALAIAVMLLSLPLADTLGHWILSLQGTDATGKASPISGIPVAILIGLLLRNFVGLHDLFKSGLQFSVTKILRLGIILVGLKLSFLDVLELGAWGIPLVFVAISGGLFFVIWFNRFLKLPERLGTLIAAGTSICGVTAIVSTAPIIKAEEKEVAYAVANVTLFGLLGMLTYPYLAHVLFGASEEIGLFLGTAIHDTSQVVGAALTYKEVYQDEMVLKAATITKLTRNLFLAAVIPLLAFYYLSQQTDSEVKPSVKIKKLLPVFVLGFVAMALVRSLGDVTSQNGAAFGIFNRSAWQELTRQIGEVWGSKYLLGTALASVGLSTSFSIFKNVGVKPFAVGLAGALFVGLLGFLMSLFLGRFIHSS
jgi:uncharacterized integral membrane protein (TIGR00698 family)